MSEKVIESVTLSDIDEHQDAKQKLQRAPLPPTKHNAKKFVVYEMAST